MQFEWDDNKAKENLRKHKVSFSEASTVFEDRLSVTFPDEDHSLYENRYIIIGNSRKYRLLIVFFTERNNHIRLISARKANLKESRKYEKEK